VSHPTIYVYKGKTIKRQAWIERLKRAEDIRCRIITLAKKVKENKK
jgi:hypothetical protein